MTDSNGEKLDRCAELCSKYAKILFTSERLMDSTAEALKVHPIILFHHHYYFYFAFAIVIVIVIAFVTVFDFCLFELFLLIMRL